MSDHAFLPPSGAGAWSKCAMWATMNQRFPQTEESAEAQEGTAAHWVAFHPYLQPRSYVVQIADPTPNGFLVTQEMVEGAELLQDTVMQRCDGLTLHVEEPINCFQIHPKCYGTPDLWARTGVSKRIEIVDYKFGHRFVDEYFNPQGLLYLCGILEKEFGQTDKLDPDITVSFTVVQPRCYYKGSPVRTHTFKLREVIPYTVAIRGMAEQACLPNPVATTNPSCCYCPGRHACSALQQAAYSDAEFATDRTPLELAPDAAGLELKMLSRALERLEARVDGLREQTLANIKAGKRVPYFHVEQGYGRLAWKHPDAEVIALGELFGVNLAKPAVITPTQAIKQGVDETVISAYAGRNLSAAKLVADNPADARRVFSTIQEP